MKRLPVQIGLGAVVVFGGVLLLLEAVGVTPSPVLWAIVLAGAAAMFGYAFFAEPASWWAALPSGALLGAAIAALMGLDPAGLGQWAGVPFLAAVSLGFWAVYFRDRRRWWSVIPAGIVLALSVVTAIAAAGRPAGAGAVLLIGAAATFALVAVLPAGGAHRWWAWIPAGVLASAAVVVLFSATEWLVALNVVWPLLIIAAGAVLIGRAISRRRSRNRPAVPTATPDDPRAGGTARERWP